MPETVDSIEPTTENDHPPTRRIDRDGHRRSAGTMEARADEFRTAYDRVKAEIAKVIVGHDEIVHGVLTCLFVGGHALLEGVPGLGKTLLVRTLADALTLDFNRIQFTPDLMPADIIGTNIVMEGPDGRHRQFTRYACLPNGHMRRSGRAISILEADEAVVPQLVQAIPPRVVVFTNLFRDQLDRYGEVDSVAHSGTKQSTGYQPIRYSYSTRMTLP